jgi:hypothetical protein
MASASGSPVRRTRRGRRPPPTNQCGARKRVVDMDDRLRGIMRVARNDYEATREAAAAFAKLAAGSDQLPLLSLGELFRQRSFVRPFAGRNRVVRVDADEWPTLCVDANPISCA